MNLLLAIIIILAFVNPLLICGNDRAEIQRYDGWYNNPYHTDYGSAGSTLVHKAGAAYADDVQEMVQEHRPLPGFISDRILRADDGLGTTTNLSALFAFFGQFVSGEIVSTTSSGHIACPAEKFTLVIGDFGNCTGKDNCTNSTTRKSPFFRAAYDPKSGQHANNPRKPINFVSSWIDGSSIYGTSEPWANSLRSFEGGRLKVHGNSLHRNVERIPLLNFPPPAVHPDFLPYDRLFVLGSFKSNQHPPILAISFLFHRYHNSVADRFRREHPNWTDEQLFQTTRRYVIAVLQNIILYEYLPALLGGTLPEYTGYQPYINPTISVEFQAAAFRAPHSFLPSGFYLRNGSRRGECKFWSFPLCWSYWRAESLFFNNASGTLDDLLRGMSSQKMERADRHFADGVQNRLFAGPSPAMSQTDLAALNIMRGRDLGVADYNTVREAYGMGRRERFDNINPNLAHDEPEVLPRLAAMYDNRIDRLDLFVGGLLEMEEKNEGVVGDTFRLIIADQFLRLRNGDRFWFENLNNGIFTADQIKEIGNVRLSDVILAATNIAKREIQPDVFHVTGSPCQQPYQLNATNLNSETLCGGPRSYDFFSGSEWSFIFTICLLIAMPCACCMIAVAFAYRKKKVTQTTRAMNRAATMRLASSFMADEYIDTKVSRRVQICFDYNTGLLKTYSREARALRVVNFKLAPRTIMVYLACELESNCGLVIKVPKEYDLVLFFQNIDLRLRFMDNLRSFLISGPVKRYIIEEHIASSDLFSKAMTLTQRRSLLETFFHTAFDQVLHAKSQSRVAKFIRKSMTSLPSTRNLLNDGSKFNFPRFGGSLRRNESSLPPTTRNSKRHLLMMLELNKQEFAEAFQLKPDSLFVQQMFALADKDQNGYISYPEFIDILALQSEGTMESKMRMLFDMYDLDGSQALDRNELKVMISSLLDIAGDRLDDDQMNEIINNMMVACGLDKKTLLSFQDFFVLIQKNQLQLADDLSARGFGFTRCEEDISLHIIENSPSPVLVEKHEHSRLMRHWIRLTYYLENNWNRIFILVLFFLLCTKLFFGKASEYYYLKEHTGARQVTGLGICASRGAATVISFCYGILILTVCRNLITLLRTTWLAKVIPFDDAIVFHKIVAYTALLATLIHVIGHAIDFYEVATQPPIVLRCMFSSSIYMPWDYMPTFSFWIYGTVAGVTGLLLVLLLSIVYIFANSLTRQHIYNAFYVTHRLFVVIYALTFIHGSGKLLQEPIFYTFVSGPIALYLIDWFISLQIQSVSATILRAEVLPSDVLYLSFKLPANTNYHSGQYIRLSCPAINRREYHPFTITTAPHEKHLSVNIRAVGPWTRRLLGLFKEALQTDGGHYGSTFPTMYLDGPYGSSHQDWYKFEVVVLVGAGIGVTPHASVLKDLIHKVYQARSDIKCRQMYFAWVARTHTQFEWFIDILREVEKQDALQLARTDIFITQLMKDFDLRTMMLYICEHQFQQLSNGSIFTGLRAKSHFGRPNFDQYLSSIRQQHSETSKIAVFTCGPKTVVHSVERACTALNRKYTSGPRLIAYHEIF